MSSDRDLGEQLQWGGVYKNLKDCPVIGDEVIGWGSYICLVPALCMLPSRYRSQLVRLAFYHHHM